MIELTYEQWLAANDLEKKIVECPECGGFGEIECDACGHFSECEECEGRGKWDETRDEYENRLREDRERLKKHQQEVSA